MNVACRELVPIIQAALSTGARVRFTATGGSMIPHIRSGEVVELEGIAFTEVAAGDVILARRPDGVYVLHRVARLDDGRAYLVSDAGRHDGWIEADQIVGRAASVVRRGRTYALNTPNARFVGLTWMRMGTLATGTLGLYLALRRRFGVGARDQECDRNPA